MPFNKVGNSVDLGKGGQFSINTTTAKGLEKVIGLIARFTINLQSATDDVLYGKFELQDADSKGIRQGIKKILDRGVLDAVEKFAGVDFCKLFTYLLDQVNVPGIEPFNPDKPPVDPTPFEKKKWNMQKKAYDLQEKIDNFQAIYGDISSQASLKGIITQMLLTFDEILGPNALGDPEFKGAFPETTLVTNYFNDVRAQLNSYIDITIPNEDIQLIFNYIDGTKTFLIVIQSLNDPKQILSFANKITGGVIDREIQDVNEILKPEKFGQLINQILKNSQKLNFYGKKVLNYINVARTVLRLVLLLVKIIRVLIASIKVIAKAIPSVFTTAGEPFILSQVYQDKLKSEGFDKLIKRLNQINLTLLLMVGYVNTLVFALDDIIRKLTVIQTNIQACNRKPSDLLNNINNTILELQSTKQELQSFLDGVNDKKENKDRTFGEYTIKILTEELADEGISVKRRYGVAVNNKGISVVQSLPTFASLDEIIIQEVKFLLLSNNLVKSSTSDISPKDAEIITQSMKFLGDTEDLNMGLDDVVLPLEEDDGDVSEFANNLPGGRNLRIKARKKLIAENEKVKKELNATDPNGNYTKSIVQKKDQQSTQLKISNLEDEKKGLQIKIAALAASVGGAIFIPPLAKRINEINDELDKLNSTKKLVSANNRTTQE